MEDDEIREALRRGDTELAFRLLVRAHGSAIYTRCCRILRNRSAAQDVMQQSMMAAFNHRRQLLEVEQIRGWLIQIAVRKSLDALRSSKRIERLSRNVAEVADSDAAEVDGLLEQLATTQDHRALEECLAALPADLAAAVQMRYIDGMSWAHIAAAVGMPPDTIRMRVQRGALRSLRDCLASHEVAS